MVSLALLKRKKKTSGCIPTLFHSSRFLSSRIIQLAPPAVLNNTGIFFFLLWLITQTGCHNCLCVSLCSWFFLVSPEELCWWAQVIISHGVLKELLNKHSSPDGPRC
ncbi:hypothetical protein GOODEAATRI_027000 [Goodea atripinnis]|uniref:Uncharacterized protein n=1 Tax=Goodea atripinnis TaxID=208336 RepID=A0ABV0P862_9TELE